MLRFVPPKGLYGVDVHQAVKNLEIVGRGRKCDSGSNGSRGDAMRSL